MKLPKPKPAFREADLCDPIRDYLTGQGYSVRCEVRNCDITAIKGDELVVVELKRGFTIELLMQAVERQRFADSVYVAIPVAMDDKRRRRNTIADRYNKESRRRELLLKRLGLGLILVGFPDDTDAPPVVEIVLHPIQEQKPRKRATVKRAVLREATGRSYDYNTGGSAGKKIVTAYREEAIFLACCLERHGPMTPARARMLGASERAQNILYRNVYDWFERQERGLYAVRASGLAHIGAEYAPLAQTCRARLCSDEMEGDAEAILLT